MKDFVYDYIIELSKTRNVDKLTYDETRGRVELMGGYKVVTWNREGINMAYDGTALFPNISVTIKLDGGTRTGFNGVIYDVEQFDLILNKLVR